MKKSTLTLLLLITFLTTNHNAQENVTYQAFERDT